MSDAPLFTAIADPMRRRLITYLAERSPRTATQLAEEFPITRQGVLKHLQVLERAGLVAVHQHGRDKRYSLTPGPLRELDSWVAEISALWDARLLRLKAMLEQEGGGE